MLRERRPVWFGRIEIIVALREQYVVIACEESCGCPGAYIWPAESAPFLDLEIWTHWKISLMLTYTTTVELVLAKDVRDVCTERDLPEIKLSANSRANRHIHPSRNTRHHEKVYI